MNAASGAAELAVAPDAAQHRFAGHPALLRRAGEPGVRRLGESGPMKAKRARNDEAGRRQQTNA